MSRSIIIKDDKGNIIGSQRTASSADILTFISKGFQVFDRRTNELIEESAVSAEIGVSDGEIILG